LKYSLDDDKKNCEICDIKVKFSIDLIGRIDKICLRIFVCIYLDEIFGIMISEKSKISSVTAPPTKQKKKIYSL